jgi:hypothetical protein
MNTNIYNIMAMDMKANPHELLSCAQKARKKRLFYNVKRLKPIVQRWQRASQPISNH